MQSAVIDKIIDKLIESELAKPEEIIGCSEEEVIELEQQFNITCPKLYREFLLKMGHQAGSFFQGSSVFLSASFSSFKDRMLKLLDENGNNFKLPLNAFVFFSHQDYQFNFFLLEGNDDPPIYFYLGAPIDEEIMKKRWKSFSEFLLYYAELEIKLNKDIKRLKRRREYLKRKANKC